MLTEHDTGPAGGKLDTMTPVEADFGITREVFSIGKCLLIENCNVSSFFSSISRSESEFRFGACCH